MTLWEIFLVSLSLGADALAVSVSLSVFLKNPTSRQKFRVFFHFGLFQFLFPLIGYYLVVFWNIKSGYWGKLIAGAILVFLGIKMFLEGFKEEEEKLSSKGDLTKGLSLILFSAGVSIDAMSVGVSMALLKQGIWLLATLAGILTAIMSYFGITFGRIIGSRLGKYTEFAGGLVLILLGLKIGFIK